MLEIEIPSCETRNRQADLSPESPDLIDGVKITPFPYVAGRSWVFSRSGCASARDPGGFPRESTQISAALSYPGTIKAFHFHKHQTDCWVPVQGMFQVALVDLRQGSRTHAARNTLYIGALRPWQLIIPPGVAHGYKVIGSQPAMLVYLTDRFYDPDDEGRIPTIMSRSLTIGKPSINSGFRDAKIETPYGFRGGERWHLNPTYPMSQMAS